MTRRPDALRAAADDPEEPAAPWLCGECGARWVEELSHTDRYALDLPRPRCPECGGLNTDDDFNADPEPRRAG
jgi:hypothetical protein